MKKIMENASLYRNRKCFVKSRFPFCTERTANFSMNRGVRKGSSTVLVILVIVLLVSLSALSVATTNSSYKLSKRMGEHYKMFYELESETDKCFAAVDVLNKRYLVGEIDEITIQDLETIGCDDPFVDDNRIGFYVTKHDRMMYVELERLCCVLRIVEWREVPQEFDFIEFD